MADHGTEAAPDPKTDASVRLALVVGRLNRKMLRATEGLAHGTLSALSSIVKSGPLRLNELAQREGIAAATITRIVADLEVRGFVSREVDKTDRRAFTIEATPEGLGYILQARSARAEIIRRLLDTVDPAELDTVVAALPVLEELALVSPSGPRG